MISLRSIQNFFAVNTTLTSLGLTQFWAINWLQEQHGFDTGALGTCALFVARNYLLMSLINRGVSSKPKINNALNKEAYPFEFHINVAGSTMVSVATYLLSSTYLTYHPVSSTCFHDLINFVPMSFVFEVLFDLFHYLMHRTLHLAAVYPLFHKKHHRFAHPSTIITYYQDPIDLLHTNMLPVLATIMIMTNLFWIPISVRSLNLLLVYKEYIEICGHTGFIVHPTNSFPQCIWLPRFLGITLHTEDHDIHHTHLRCNYSKRFSLWDKAFGTFLPFQAVHQQAMNTEPANSS